MKIITNNQARELIYWHDLTEKEKADFDYIEDQEKQDDFRGFRYKGNVYDLGEFMHCTQSVNGFSDWHGIQSETYFSGVLVKYADKYCESVIIGRYCS